MKGHFGLRIHPIANAGIPTALIHGTLDGESKLADAAATFDHIQDSPKAFVTIVGANHYGITNINNPANPPGIPPIHADPNSPTLDQEQAIAEISRWSGLFLRAHVLQDRDALEALQRLVDQNHATAIVH